MVLGKLTNIIHVHKETQNHIKQPEKEDDVNQPWFDDVSREGDDYQPLYAHHGSDEEGHPVEEQLEYRQDKGDDSGRSYEVSLRPEKVVDSGWESRYQAEEVRHRQEEEKERRRLLPVPEVVDEYDGIEETGGGQHDALGAAEHVVQGD